MNQTKSAMESLKIEERSLELLERLEAKIGKFGGRRFSITPTVRNDGVPLKYIISVIESLTENILQIQSGTSHIVRGMVAILKEKHEEGNDLLSETNLIIRILTWTRSFFGNFGLRNHLDRLNSIEAKLGDIIDTVKESHSISNSVSSSSEFESEIHNLKETYPILPYQRAELRGLYIHDVAIETDDVSKIIAAKCALMRPGLLSFSDIESHSRLPSVSIDTDGLKICIDLVPEYAVDLCSSLQEACLCSVRVKNEKDGILFVTDPLEICYFLKEICLINLEEAANWLTDCSLFGTQFGNEIIEGLKKDLHHFRYAQKMDQIVLYQPKINFMFEYESYSNLRLKIGSRISLLRPGGNSYHDALHFTHIPNVEWNHESHKLHIQVHDISYGEELERTFYALGYTEFWFEHIHVATDNVEEDLKAQIVLTDIKEIVQFLDEACLLVEDEISLFLQDFKTVDVNTPFYQLDDKQLELEEDIKRVVNEYYRPQKKVKDENFTFTVDEVNVDILKLNPTRMRVRPIPELPENAKELGMEEMLTYFDQINFKYPAKEGYLDPETVIPNESSKELIERGLTKFWLVALGKIVDLYGIPKKEQERAKYRLDLTKILKHITHLLEYAPPYNRAMALINLGIGGENCGGRLIQEAILSYINLKVFSTEPIYQTERIIKELSTQDARLYCFLDQKFIERRIQIFNEITSRVNEEHSDLKDITHTRNFYMKLVGEELGIPGANVCQFEDPFEDHAATTLSKEDFLEEFYEKYSPATNIHFLSQLFGYQTKLCDPDMREVFIDIFVLHRPSEFAEMERSNVISELYPNFIIPDRKYITQLLQYYKVIY